MYKYLIRHLSEDGTYISFHEEFEKIELAKKFINNHSPGEWDNAMIVFSETEAQKVLWYSIIKW